MRLRFVKPFTCYRAGQIVCAGPGQALGGGVAEGLLRRKIAELIPDEPTETEPRPQPKARKRGG